EDGVPWLGPVEQLLGLLRPVRVRILAGLLVDRLVRDQRVVTELRRGLEQLLVEELLELLLDLVGGGLRGPFHLAPSRSPCGPGCTRGLHARNHRGRRRRGGTPPAGAARERRAGRRLRRKAGLGPPLELLELRLGRGLSRQHRADEAADEPDRDA